MKFAFKLAANMIVLLSIVLSLGGYLMISKSFDESISIAKEQNTESHIREKYAFETTLLQLRRENGGITYDRIYQYCEGVSRYVGDNAYLFAVYTSNDTSIFSNMPLEIGKTVQLEAINSGENKIKLYKGKNDDYMLFSSPVILNSETFHLVNAYKITHIFNMRKSQIDSFLQIQAACLACALVVIVIISIILTRPISRLEKASKAIAQGKYSLRTSVKTNDEIGKLSAGFDTMATAIESKINELEEAIVERNNFVSAFTHELKTPMTSMLGYADVLRLGKRDEKTQKKAANYIYSETKRLEALSQKLMLLMSLVKDEKLQLEKVKLSSIIFALKASLPKSTAAIKYDIEKNISIIGDKDLMCDLLRNLIINALRAIDEKGVVIVSAEYQNGLCILSVSDSGTGIPESEIERITQPFYMVDKSRARANNGSGMGLALCSKIAVAHNSILKIESEIGKGTRVSLAISAEKEAQI